MGHDFCCIYTFSRRSYLECGLSLYSHRRHDEDRSYWMNMLSGGYRWHVAKNEGKSATLRANITAVTYLIAADLLDLILILKR